MTNLQEYLAGTSPIDPTSVLQITAINLNGSNVLLSFNSANGKSYLVEKTANLSLNTTWSIVQDNIAGTGGTILVTDTGGGTSPPQGYYRVRQIKLVTK